MDDFAENLNGAGWLLTSDEDRQRMLDESDPVARAEELVARAEYNLLKSLMICHRLGVDARHVF